MISHGTLNRSPISDCSSRKLSSLRPAIRGLAWYDAAKRRADALPKTVEAPVTSTHEFLIASGFTRFPDPCIGQFCRSLTGPPPPAQIVPLRSSRTHVLSVKSVSERVDIVGSLFTNKK